MNLYKLREKIVKIDADVLDLRSDMLVEMAYCSNNPIIPTRILTLCNNLQNEINSIKRVVDYDYLQQEDEEMMREQWEEEQVELEEEYYMEEI